MKINGDCHCWSPGANKMTAATDMAANCAKHTPHSLHPSEHCLEDCHCAQDLNFVYLLYCTVVRMYYTFFSGFMIFVSHYLQVCCLDVAGSFICFRPAMLAMNILVHIRQHTQSLNSFFLLPPLIIPSWSHNSRGTSKEKSGGGVVKCIQSSLSLSASIHPSFLPLHVHAPRRRRRPLLTNSAHVGVVQQPTTT